MQSPASVLQRAAERVAVENDVTEVVETADDEVEGGLVPHWELDRLPADQRDLQLG